MFYEQREFSITCEWGERGVSVLAPLSDALVIVDVLSFSTCVEVAVRRGATVYPYAWRDASEVTYAASVGAILAKPSRQSAGGYSLAPSSLLDIPSGTRLVLPSPNGSALSMEAGKRVATLAGCFRNASAVAAEAAKIGPKVAVIPAGERWPDQSMRPAVEDLLGAGAIIHALPGTKSPEAQIAEASFLRFRRGLLDFLRQCSSGKELINRHFDADVVLAAEHDVSDCVPILHDRAYVSLRGIHS